MSEQPSLKVGDKVQFIKEEWDKYNTWALREKHEQAYEGLWSFIIENGNHFTISHIYENGGIALKEIDKHYGVELHSNMPKNGLWWSSSNLFNKVRGKHKIASNAEFRRIISR